MPDTKTHPATATGSGNALLRLLAAIACVAGALGYTWVTVGQISLILVIASGIGMYMAMNIGANDVANNVGPAVGARAMSLTQAILIAAVFEAMGAIIAGGEVVTTIKGGIIDATQIDDAATFVWLMVSALLAGALWLNLATWLGAPVSTTHSIVGGVLGAGIAAAGWGLANWETLSQIAASWVISPVSGGLIAAAFLYLIKRTVTYQPDLMAAARRMVPLLLALMAWAFTAYLIRKGLNQVVTVSFGTAALLGALVAAVLYFLLRPRIAVASTRLSNDKDGVNRLFTVPLMFAAALLSFAHGSNDVANAIGPLAAIYDALVHLDISSKAPVPTWIMVMGAIGLSVGLALYGPRLIRTVGSEITEMDQTRAYCIAMSAAVTVIVASELGLPISTTHVAIGAVFGVGFLREYLKVNYQRIIQEIEQHHQAQQSEREVVEAFLHAFERASIKEKGEMLRNLKQQAKAGATHISKRERKDLRKVYRQNLVKRSLVLKVIAAWIVTVPASAGLAALIFFAIRGASIS
jgi:PiT family inorganic phosphate transporter